MAVDLKRIIEGLIFVSETPLNLAQICAVLETEEKAVVAGALAALVEEYQGLDRAFTLVEVAGGWGFRTNPELAFWIRKLKRDQVTRLSRAALETLAVIAYKQPVMKAEIERMRGVEVSGVLRMLMEKDLVRVAGRKDLPGRPLIYGTTRRFLEVFDLKDLKDLPTLEEMEALAESAAALVGPGETGDLFAPGAVNFAEDAEPGPEYAEGDESAPEDSYVDGPSLADQADSETEVESEAAGQPEAREGEEPSSSPGLAQAEAAPGPTPASASSDPFGLGPEDDDPPQAA
ncbi:MAG: SMC-Scp complex subunit ScpB [Desulfarculus sp.]|nr:SMC-Scp complex subunit ScpB [Desulfarculus sp.]